MQKRRIYDITNVLEGIGLIEKKSKNNIQWKPLASAGDEDLQRDIATLSAEIAQLQVPDQACCHLWSHILTLVPHRSPGDVHACTARTSTGNPTCILGCSVAEMGQFLGVQSDSDMLEQHVENVRSSIQVSAAFCCCHAWHPAHPHEGGCMCPVPCTGAWPVHQAALQHKPCIPMHGAEPCMPWLRR